MGSATSGFASTRRRSTGRSESSGRRIGPVSPASRQSGARSPMTTCWSMWKLKSSRSPIAAIGEAKASTRSDEAEREEELPPARGGLPARAQRPDAAPVRERDERERRELERVERPRRERGRVHAFTLESRRSCGSSTTTWSRAACARSRRGTSASSGSTSSRGTGGSATTTSRSSPGRRGRSSTGSASSSG